MGRNKNRRMTRNEGAAEQFVSTAVGAAEALSVGALRLTERTLIETLRMLQDVGGELGSAVVRTARGSIKAAEDIGGDLAEVGKGLSRGVARPARQLGGGVLKVATDLWTNAAGGVQTAPGRRLRKGPVKVSARRTRRRSVA